MTAGPATRRASVGSEWLLMAILLSFLVVMLYTHARGARARLMGLNRQADEFSDYFKRVKPQYDLAYTMCERLSKLAPADQDAARILRKHNVQIHYDQKPAAPP